MKYHLSYNVFTDSYCCTLLGGEFSNCHGQGSTIEDAVMVLKIRINQLRQVKK